MCVREGTCHRNNSLLTSMQHQQHKYAIQHRAGDLLLSVSSLIPGAAGTRTAAGLGHASRGAPSPGRHVPRSGINVGFRMSRAHTLAHAHTRARESAKSLPERSQLCADKIAVLSWPAGCGDPFWGTCRTARTRQDWAPVAAVLGCTCGFSHPLLLLIEVSL